MAIFQHINKGGKDSLTIVFGDGSIQPISGEHPGFQSILEALKAKASDDLIRGLADPANLIFTKTHRLTDRITLAGGTLLLDGDVLEGPLADFIVNIAQNSDNESSYMAWVKFVDKLATNPSPESRDHLFMFMTTHGITVTPEGDIVLYKGVNADGTSIHAGYGIVDGQAMDGNLPNKVGSVLEFPRSKVNANRGIGCATGLHAGTHEYASAFSRGQLLTVVINPRDVVSVPSDHENSKVRVSRYTVLEINQSEKAYSQPVYGSVEDDDFDDEDSAVDVYFEDDVQPDDLDEDADETDEDDEPLAVVVDNPFEAKVQDALNKIPSVIKSGWDKSLALYISKNVTPGQRDAWREARRRVGIN